MNQAYLDSVVLATLSERLSQKQSTSLSSLREVIGGYSYSSISAAIRRLETAERLHVERAEGIENQYTILDGPTALERQTLVMHLAHRDREAG